MYKKLDTQNLIKKSESESQGVLQSMENDIK